MARRQPGEPFAATWLAVAAVAVLAIAVGALSLFAYERAHPPAAAQSVAPVPTFGSDSTPSPTATPTPTPTVATLDRSTERFFSMTTRAMWRGTAGACGTAEPLVERSTDGGRTWADVTARYRQVTQLLSLDAFTPTEGQLVAGVGPECQAQALRTFTQGQFWEPNAAVLAASSFIDLRDASKVVTPTGTIAAPCADATGLRSAGTRIALVCDGEAYILGAANSWQPAGIDGALALAFTDDGMLVAHIAPSTCTGVAVSLVVGADAPALIGCASGVDPSTGAIAIATADSKVLVWAGDSIVDVAP